MDRLYPIEDSDVKPELLDNDSVINKKAHKQS